jgi:hypothetical protein
MMNHINGRLTRLERRFAPAPVRCTCWIYFGVPGPAIRRCLSVEPVYRMFIRRRPSWLPAGSMVLLEPGRTEPYVPKPSPWSEDEDDFMLSPEVQDAVFAELLPILTPGQRRLALMARHVVLIAGGDPGPERGTAGGTGEGDEECQEKGDGAHPSSMDR